MKTMRTTVTIAAVGLGLVVSVGTARPGAHHAFSAEFDANQPVELRGTVTRMEWVNPHSWIHLEVKGGDGTVEKWMIEGGPPTSLLRRGFDRNSLLAGTEVIVQGFRAKSGKNVANGRDITLSDGQTLFLGSSGTGAPSDGRDPTER